MHVSQLYGTPCSGSKEIFVLMTKPIKHLHLFIALEMLPPQSFFEWAKKTKIAY